MRAIKKPLRQVSAALYRKLYSLNLRDEGSMQELLTQKRQEKDGGIIHYILDGTQLIGWSHLYLLSGNRIMTCHLYVRKTERGKGYGKQLLFANIKYVKQMGKAFKVTLDGDNRKFFKKVKRSKYRKYPGKRLKSNEFA